MNYETFDIKFDQGISKLHRFSNESKGIPVLLIHGYFEDGRIFYSKNKKGFAPYLAQYGNDVYVCDLLGKGSSTPATHSGLKHSQYEIIMRDIPAYLDFIRTKTGQSKMHIGTHSWGGVIALAYLARTQDDNILSVFNFGSKRRIGIKGIKKLIAIDLAWDLYGKYLTKKHGYLPANKMKMGTENEPADYFLQTNIWVKEKEWISPVDGFNYHEAFLKFSLPPTLYITGSNDKILGHARDVKRLIEETGDHQNTTFKIIGKKTGHKNNYDHINLLTHKDAPNDHFPFVLDFIRQFK